jgi:hypothetical protein
MLVFEDPNSDTLWLCKATPREWLEDGSTVAATGVPTRWGKVSFEIRSQLKSRRVETTLELPAAAGLRTTNIRLRVPGKLRIAAVTLDGIDWKGFDPARETITLPASAAGKLKLTVTYR